MAELWHRGTPAMVVARAAALDLVHSGHSVLDTAGARETVDTQSR